MPQVRSLKKMSKLRSARTRCNSHVQLQILGLQDAAVSVFGKHAANVHSILDKLVRESLSNVRAKR
jgi:hypothetical protein